MVNLLAGIRRGVSLRDAGEKAFATLEDVIGRRMLWRVGRLVYRYARRDGPNDPTINGEYRLQRQLAELTALRKEELVVLDIGANTGFWAESMLAAAQAAGFTAMRLIAFEPSDDCRSALQERLAVRLKGFQVDVRSEAVADHSGEVMFDATPGLGQSKQILSGPASVVGVPQVAVSVTTLEAIFADLQLASVPFVKSDVEGYDLAVLRGALPLLRAGRIGVLQFEYNHRWVATRSFLRDVFEMTEGLPYEVCKVVPEGLDRYAAWHPELETFFEANFALVHRDWAEALGTRAGAFDISNTYA